MAPPPPNLKNKDERWLRTICRAKAHTTIFVAFGGGSAFKKDAVAAGFLSEVGASYEYDGQLMHHLRPILVGFTLDRRMRGGGSGWEFGRVWFMALVLKTSTSKKSREFKSHSSRKK